MTTTGVCSLKFSRQMFTFLAKKCQQSRNDKSHQTGNQKWWG